MPIGHWHLVSGGIYLTPKVMRFVPAVCGTLMIPTIYFVARQLLSKRASLLAALFVGDTVIGFHKLMLVVYLSFALNVAIGMWVGEHRKVLRISGATLLGAIQFFLITNFAVWVAFTTYPKSLTGLIACYVGGLPYFWNTLAGDAVYVTLLFGGYVLAERRVGKTREVTELQS